MQKNTKHPVQNYDTSPNQTNAARKFPQDDFALPDEKLKELEGFIMGVAPSDNADEAVQSQTGAMFDSHWEHFGIGLNGELNAIALQEKTCANDRTKIEAALEKQSRFSPAATTMMVWPSKFTVKWWGLVLGAFCILVCFLGSGINIVSMQLRQTDSLWMSTAIVSVWFGIALGFKAFASQTTEKVAKVLLWTFFFMLVVGCGTWLLGQLQTLGGVAFGNDSGINSLVPNYILAYSGQLITELAVVYLLFSLGQRWLMVSTNQVPDQDYLIIKSDLDMADFKAGDLARSRAVFEGALAGLLASRKVLIGRALGRLHEAQAAARYESEAQKYRQNQFNKNRLSTN